jgi:hypothetical protein
MVLATRDKKVVGVFVRFRAPSLGHIEFILLHSFFFLLFKHCRNFKSNMSVLDAMHDTPVEEMICGSW